jgi:hypothetical protein
MLDRSLRKPLLLAGAGTCAVVLAGLAPVVVGACYTTEDIHQTLETQNKPCVSCHESAYVTTTDPAHVGLLPDTCETCHSTGEWMPAAIPLHAAIFPLEGVHASTACSSCHTTGYDAGATPTTCIGCHMADFAKSTYPGHSAFPTTCNLCHTLSGWTGANVHPESLFPITTGSHASASIVCTDCHDLSRGTSVAGQNTTCVSCHLGAHTRPAIDSAAPHVALGAAYPGPNAASPNFCLGCHAKG